MTAIELESINSPFSIPSSSDGPTRRISIGGIPLVRLFTKAARTSGAGVCRRRASDDESSTKQRGCHWDVGGEEERRRSKSRDSCGSESASGRSVKSGKSFWASNGSSLRTLSYTGSLGRVDATRVVDVQEDEAEELEGEESAVPRRKGSVEKAVFANTTTSVTVTADESERRGNSVVSSSFFTFIPPLCPLFRKFPAELLLFLSSSFSLTDHLGT